MLILRKILLTSAVLFTCVFCLSANDQDSSMFGIFTMDIEELMNAKVSIATKSEQPLNETPAIVSVITSEEITRMGAREFEDILQLIPGIELNRNYGGYYIIGVRGVKDSRTSSKILILIDGVPYNQVFLGSSLPWGYDININNIDRVEIIRGPGSALYGRNAFSGVVNIINKSGKTGEKLYAKAEYGSYNTKIGSVSGGFSKGDIHTHLGARAVKTDLTNVTSDNGYGRESKWNLYRDNLVLDGRVDFGKFTATGMYYDLSGGATLLDTKIKNNVLNYSFRFADNPTPKLNYELKAYGHHSSYVEDIEELPANYTDTIPNSGGIRYSDSYPDGIYYVPGLKEYIYGFEAEMKYRLFPGNDLLVGLQGDIHGVNDVEITSNVIYPNDTLLMPYPLQGITRETQVKYEPGWFENEKHDYYNLAFLAQDIWCPMKKLGITIGLRYDIDSEIGAIFNPRMGFVYIPEKNTTVKLLYGKAYRAPSPSEQYVTLGYAIGNKNLEPEKINTFEVSITNISGYVNQSLSLYLNKLSNMIYAARKYYVDPENTYYNIGRNTSTGLEYENRLFLSKSFSAFFNYAYAFSVNSDSLHGSDSLYYHPDIAPHKINLGANYSFLKHFNLHASLIYRSKMEQFTLNNSKQKVKNSIGDYALINCSFQINELFLKGLHFSFSVFNMFDKKYYAQDNQHPYQPSQPGRHIVFGVSYMIK